MGFFEFFAGILAWFYALVPSYGLAIILLTLATRVILLPLSIKSTRSMREMQVIQPEIKRLQKKYKGDRQKMNTELMALYKEHGVNPFGGCLPLLLQMPVFIALFNVIQKPLNYLPDSALSTALSGASTVLDTHLFVGLRLDCSPANVWSENAPSPVGQIEELCGKGPLGALPYIALLLLMGASTYYQQRQMMAKRGPITDPQQQQMQTFARVMPAVLLVFGLWFPTGVVLYWVTTNLWTIVQQRIMLKAAPPVEGAGGKSSAAAKGEDKGAKGKSAKGAKGGAKAKGAQGDGKAKGAQGDGKAKGQLTGGQPPRKSPAKKSPSGGSGSSKGSSKKKKKR